MKGMIDFELPFPWCAVCKGFDPAVVQWLSDNETETQRCCSHADFCQAADKARRSRHCGKIYMADPKHGVVEHTVSQIVTIYQTDARAEDGESWADQFTEEELKAGTIYKRQEEARAEAARKKKDQSRA